MLDIMVHRNIRLSDVIVSDTLDSDHLPIFFYILDYVSAGDTSAPVEIHADWERFRCLASGFM